MSDAELERLAHPDYWDEQYARVGPDQQLHGWFRSFEDLLPLFEQNLFKRLLESKILHLGSGDSVSCPYGHKSIPSSGTYYLMEHRPSQVGLLKEDTMTNCASTFLLLLWNTCPKNTLQ